MDIVSILPLLAIVLVFYFLLIRPQQRRQRELRDLQSSLQVGDEVMLTSGFFGTVHEITDEAVHVEIAEGVVIRVVRGAVGSTVRRVEEEQDLDEQDLDETTEADDDPATDTEPGTSRPEGN